MGRKRSFLWLGFFLAIGLLIWGCVQICRSLASILTAPVAILVIAAGLRHCFKSLVTSMVFPGSSLIFMHFIQVIMDRQLKEQLFQNFHSIQQNLIKILDSTIPQKGVSLQIEIVDSVFKNFQTLRVQGKINTKQQTFLNLLQEWISTLKHSVCSIQNRQTNVWELLKTDTNTHIEFKPDTPSSLIRAINLGQSIQELSVHKWHSWFTPVLLGSRDYAGTDLERRYNAELLTVPADVDISCMWVKSPSAQTSGPTILICSANAGLYEYADIQTEWVQFYYNKGVNLMLWNYRGFGNTGGRPRLDLIKKDGEAVVQFLKETFKIEKLGVHGQSLGGCIATHLAWKCDLDFLFADRTFASVGETAYFKFGKIAYWGIRLFLGGDSDSAQDYLNAKCYKILASDPEDDMIVDLGSLKSGVALKGFFRELSLTELKSKRLENQYEYSAGLVGLLVESYSQIEKELGELLKVSEQEEMERLIEIRSLMDKVRSAGKKLQRLCVQKNQRERNILWLLVLKTWWNQGESRHFSTVLSYFEYYISMTRDPLKSYLKKFQRALKILLEILKKQQKPENVGNILCLKCGHNGCFSLIEKQAYSYHLFNANFIRK